MFRRSVLLVAFICLSFSASSASAGNFRRLFSKPPAKPNPYENYEAGFQAGQMQRMGVPTYNYGYFGVRSRPYTVWHKSYAGDYVDMSFRPSY